MNGKRKTENGKPPPRTPLSPTPLVYAHRGDRSRAPDNTLEAYRLAEEAGADGVELDVRRTGDGVLIMSHDDRSAGMPPFIEMTFREVRAKLPTIPTFIETLAFIPGHVWLNVEVKNNPADADFDETRDIINRTIDAIIEHDTLSRVFLSSFDPVAMQRASTINTGLLRGQLIHMPTTLDEGIAAAVSQGAHAVNPEMGHMSSDPLSAVGSVHEAGLQIVVWDVNTPSDVKVLVDAGVDGVVADDPAMARKVIDQL